MTEVELEVEGHLVYIQIESDNVHVGDQGLIVEGISVRFQGARITSSEKV